MKGKYARRRAARQNGHTHVEPSPEPAIDVEEFRRTLEATQIGPLRDIARREGVTPGRKRKADIIDAVIEAVTTRG